MGRREGTFDFNFHKEFTWPRTKPFERGSEPRYKARSYSCASQVSPTLPTSEGSATKVVWISDPCLAQSVGLESRLNIVKCCTMVETLQASKKLQQLWTAAME